MDEKKILTLEETKDKALRLLSFRAHSERDLSQKLKRSGATDENIEAVLKFARRYRFVDDADYARKLASDLAKLKKFGTYRIRMELSKKGVSSENIELALSALDNDEPEILLPLIEKRLKGNFEKKNVDKIIRYFLYRGYQFSDIKECINTLKTEHEGEDLWDIT